MPHWTTALNPLTADPETRGRLRDAAAADIPTEQLVLDMRELLATERVILDAIITLFVKLDIASSEMNR